MMLIRGANIFGIKRIVINRKVIWQREPAGCDKLQMVWRKVAGGRGFDATVAAGSRKATKSQEQMAVYINHLLDRYIVTGFWGGHEVVSDLYRWWITCETGTLNIVLNDLKKRKGNRA